MKILVKNKRVSMEEETLHFNKAIKNLEWIFLIAGIYIRSKVRAASDHFKSRCVYVINFVIANHEMLGSVYYCIDGVRTRNDINALIFSAPCITISILAQFKGMYLLKNEKNVEKLIEKLRELELEEKQRPQSADREKIVQQEIKFLNVVLKTLNILYVSLVMTFATSPLVLIALKYFQTKKVELTLPFLVIYPFDPLQIAVWPFVYLHQFWSECVVSLDICSADYFFFTCCTYIRMQFRLLKHDLEIIIPDQVNNEQFVADEEFHNKFRKLIKWHQDLIELTSILEIIYSKSTLLNFLSSSLIICLTGFNVTMVSDVAFIVTFLSFLFMSLLQVFFLCFFADLLMTSSMEISDAVYNCNWYLTDVKIRKSLLIIFMRAQKPCKLTASGFADVSLNSFMRVLSTAWSYFALLQTMYGDKKG